MGAFTSAGSSLVMMKTLHFVHRTLMVGCLDHRAAVSQEIIDSQTRTLRELNSIWSDMGVHGEAKTARLSAVRTHVLVSLVLLLMFFALIHYMFLSLLLMRHYFTALVSRHG